jgi:hypothetical protein
LRSAPTTSCEAAEEQSYPEDHPSRRHVPHDLPAIVDRKWRRMAGLAVPVGWSPNRT